MIKDDAALPSWVPRFKSGDPFLKAWSDEECMKERKRVMLRSRVGAASSVTNLHDLVTDYLHFKHDAFLDTLPPTFQALVKIPKVASIRPQLAEGILALAGEEFVKLMTSPKAAKMLRELAELVDRFPVQKGNLYFGEYLSSPDWFKPTLQDGLKAVMLGAFFDFTEKRPLAPQSLPTIVELDSAIREKWEWKGGDKELRDARRELGLSGLPRGKSGRPKKTRGR